MLGTDATADPGRVTARRLNRTEYNNTIRDLLGVTLRPADEFPVDDSGYGFDNIGDVLSLSPMLMEKYINARAVVARAAVFGEPYPEKPGQLVVLTPKKMQDDVHAKGNETPYSMRGTFYRDVSLPGRWGVRVPMAIRQLPRPREARRAWPAVRERGSRAGRSAAVGGRRDSPCASRRPGAVAGPGPAGPRRPPTEEERQGARGEAARRRFRRS